MYADPLVRDTTSWQLSPASPALKLGFEQIDVTHIGPRVGVDRHVGATGHTRAAASVQATLGDTTYNELHSKGLVRSQ